MTIASLATTLGAALVLAGAPAFASAQTQSGPIRINAVAITPENYDFDPGLASVSFTNQSHAPATRVVFDVESNGQLIGRLHDVGSFATGATIRHSYTDIYTGEGQQITVERVAFADGTTWENPDLSLSHGPAAMAAAASGAAENSVQAPFDEGY